MQKPNLKIMTKSTHGLSELSKWSSYPVIVDDNLTQKVKKKTCWGEVVEVTQYHEIYEECWGDGELDRPYFLYFNRKYADYIIECQNKARKYDELTKTAPPNNKE